MNNLPAYATIFSAYGCTLAYNSPSATFRVKEVPKGADDIVEQAVQDIALFDDTANYIDGVSSLCLADFIDDSKNPVKERARLNILHALGIMKDDRFVHQVLMAQKNNRSWHPSSVANSCEHFGDVCTHRGINPDPDRKGRRSNRKPEQYHPINALGIIAREQLVTPALEKLFRGIPDSSLISGASAIKITSFDMREFKNLSIDDRLKFLRELQEAV